MNWIEMLRYLESKTYDVSFKASNWRNVVYDQLHHCWQILKSWSLLCGVHRMSQTNWRKLSECPRGIAAESINQQLASIGFDYLKQSEKITKSYYYFLV